MDQAEWTERARGGVRVLRRRARPGWSRTTSRPGWTGRTSTTRRSTGPMPSWPPTTAPWSTRPGRSSPRTSRRSSGRCRMCGTRSGGAGSSPRWRRCSAEARALVRARWPGTRACRPLDGAAPAAVFAAVEAARAAAAAGGAVRAGHLVAARRSARTSTPRSAHPLLGAVAVHRQTASTCALHRHDGAVLHRGELVKTHPRKERGKQTDFGDYPPEKIAFHMRTPTWCRRQAARDRPGLRRR